MPIISDFITGSGSGGLAVGAVDNVFMLAASERIYVFWDDPEDVVVDGNTLAAWEGTKLRYQAGSMPKNRFSGELIIDNENRNAYSINYFCQKGLTNNQPYYFKFFPYTTEKVYTDSADNEFVVTPTAHVEGIDDWCVKNIKTSTEAGDGKMTVSWEDPEETIYAKVNRGDTPVSIPLATWAATTIVVKENGYAVDKSDAGAVYRSRVTTRNKYKASPLTITGLTNGKTYYISFFPETTDGGVCSNTSQRATGIANRITINAVPSQKGTIVYDGNTHLPEWNNYDPNKMAYGYDSQINAGTYTATFVPYTDYRWSDGSIVTKNIEWNISKAKGTLSLFDNSGEEVVDIELNAAADTFVIKVDRPGLGLIQATSSDESIATVFVSGTIITVNSVNETTGDATITVSVLADNNHTASEQKNIQVSALFLPAPGLPLDNYEWSDIDRIISAGRAEDYWSIGDCKTINVKGVVGIDEVDEDMCVYIIGFNHDGASNTVDFGTFRSSSLNGADLCLIDSMYNKGATNGSCYFNINHSSATNVGGWKGCDLRYDVLGSTDTRGKDATANTLLRVNDGTLMGALPKDLKSVMKPMLVYTDNTGNKSISLANVTESVDYLPLLAEFELFGKCTNANPGEANKQSQYTYYLAGNSKVKKDHINQTGVSWWTRSPYKGNNASFIYVYLTGAVAYNATRNSLGLAPIFRV